MWKRDFLLSQNGHIPQVNADYWPIRKREASQRPGCSGKCTHSLSTLPIT